jgi:hypothetical protein
MKTALAILMHIIEDEAMNTTQTDNDKKQETAKEIFDRILGRYRRELAPMTYRDTMKFAREIAELSWGAAARFYLMPGDEHHNQTSFMKSLFPEDIKDTSASG